MHPLLLLIALVIIWLRKDFKMGASFGDFYVILGASTFGATLAMKLLPQYNSWLVFLSFFFVIFFLMTVSTKEILKNQNPDNDNGDAQ